MENMKMSASLLARLEADWKSNTITIPDMVAKYGLTGHRLRILAKARGWGRKVRLSKAGPKPPPRQPHRRCDPDYCPDWAICKTLPPAEPVRCEKTLPDDDPALYDLEPVYEQAIPFEMAFSLPLELLQDA